MISKYAAILTPAERAAAMKLGMKLAIASHGAKHGIKIAQNPIQAGLTAIGTGATMTNNLLKTIAGLSVLSGIPIGLLWHEIGNQATQSSAAEAKTLEAIKGYHSAGRDVEKLPEYKHS